MHVQRSWQPDHQVFPAAALECAPGALRLAAQTVGAAILVVALLLGAAQSGWLPENPADAIVTVDAP